MLWVAQLLQKWNEHGLIKLFHAENLRDNMMKQTNTNCDRSGETQATINDLYTFSGLEMAMTLNKWSNIKAKKWENLESLIQLVAINASFSCASIVTTNITTFICYPMKTKKCTMRRRSVSMMMMISEVFEEIRWKMICYLMSPDLICNCPSLVWWFFFVIPVASTVSRLGHSQSPWLDIKVLK